jgi:hypothetical protein
VGKRQKKTEGMQRMSRRIRDGDIGRREIKRGRQRGIYLSRRRDTERKTE